MKGDIAIISAINTMNNTNIKNIKLISELMSFCYKYNASKVNLEVERINNILKITLISHNTILPDNILEELKDTLSCPRCHEIEEYYWSLSGDDITDSELTLIGMMIDNAIIDYNKKDKILNMQLLRNI